MSLEETGKIGKDFREFTSRSLSNKFNSRALAPRANALAERRLDRIKDNDDPAQQFYEDRQKWGKRHRLFTGNLHNWSHRFTKPARFNFLGRNRWLICFRTLDYFTSHSSLHHIPEPRVCHSLHSRSDCSKPSTEAFLLYISCPLASHSKFYLIQRLLSLFSCARLSHITHVFVIHMRLK